MFAFLDLAEGGGTDEGESIIGSGAGWTRLVAEFSIRVNSYGGVAVPAGAGKDST